MKPLSARIHRQWSPMQHRHGGEGECLNDLTGDRITKCQVPRAVFIRQQLWRRQRPHTAWHTLIWLIPVAVSIVKRTSLKTSDRNKAVPGRGNTLCGGHGRRSKTMSTTEPGIYRRFTLTGDRITVSTSMKNSSDSNYYDAASMIARSDLTRPRISVNIAVMRISLKTSEPYGRQRNDNNNRTWKISMISTDILRHLRSAPGLIHLIPQSIYLQRCHRPLAVTLLTMQTEHENCHNYGLGDK